MQFLQGRIDYTQLLNTLRLQSVFKATMSKLLPAGLIERSEEDLIVLGEQRPLRQSMSGLASEKKKQLQIRQRYHPSSKLIIQQTKKIEYDPCTKQLKRNLLL